MVMCFSKESQSPSPYQRTLRRQIFAILPNVRSLFQLARNFGFLPQKLSESRWTWRPKCDDGGKISKLLLLHRSRPQKDLVPCPPCPCCYSQWVVVGADPCRSLAPADPFEHHFPTGIYIQDDIDVDPASSHDKSLRVLNQGDYYTT